MAFEHALDPYRDNRHLQGHGRELQPPFHDAFSRLIRSMRARLTDTQTRSQLHPVEQDGSVTKEFEGLDSLTLREKDLSLGDIIVRAAQSMQNDPGQQR